MRELPDNFDAIKSDYIKIFAHLVNKYNVPPELVIGGDDDLHYSHKDEAVLALLSENKIAVVFVPAKCTDVIQECDTDYLTLPLKE